MRTLYSTYWNRQGYISTSHAEMRKFCRWLGDGCHVFKRGRTSWNIPRIERQPGYVGIPLIEPGKIEYAD